MAPYQETSLAAKDGSGASQSLAAYTGGVLPSGTTALIQIDPGVGGPTDPAVTNLELETYSNTPWGLTSLVRGLLRAIGDRGDAATINSVLGLLAKIAQNTAEGGTSSGGSGSGGTSSGGAFSSAGIGTPEDVPASLATIGVNPATPVGLVALNKAIFKLLGPIREAIGNPTDVASTGEGSIVAIMSEIRDQSTIAADICGAVDDVPVSATILAATPATPVGLVSLCKSIFLGIGSSTGAIVAPNTIEGATATPYSIAFMMRMLLGQAGGISGAIGTPADVAATSGMASATLLAIQKALLGERLMASRAELRRQCHKPFQANGLPWATLPDRIISDGGAYAGGAATGFAVRLRSLQGISITGVTSSVDYYGAAVVSITPSTDLYMLVVSTATDSATVGIALTATALTSLGYDTSPYRIVMPAILLPGSNNGAASDSSTSFGARAVNAGKDVFSEYGRLFPSGFAVLVSTMPDRYLAPGTTGYNVIATYTGA